MPASAARTRTTSAYFLRVAVTPDTADAVLTELVQAAEGQGIIVTDQHTRADDPTQPYVSLGYRATDDSHAAAISDVVRGAARQRRADWLILTGYGIHRRTVRECVSPQLGPSPPLTRSTRPPRTSGGRTLTT